MITDEVLDVRAFWGQAKKDADAREAYAKSIGGEIRRGPGTGVQDHFVGRLGEYAIAEYMDLPLPRVTPERAGESQPDPWYDFVLPNDETADVKACWYPKKALLVPTEEFEHPVVADWYVLVIVDAERGSGWIVRAATKAFVLSSAPNRKYCPRQPAHTILYWEHEVGNGLLTAELWREKVSEPT